MSSLRKLERDFAHADIAAVSSLVAQLGDEDVMARFGLESRLQRLRAAAAKLDETPEAPTASAALFFGGRPVLGQNGIEAEFGAAAVANFQDLVAKVMADETNGLGLRGVVPNKAASVLHITNIVRGSFGFLLEEARPQHDLIDTTLKTAVDKATRLLDAFGEADEEQFRSAVEKIDQRVLAKARDFFDLMRKAGATLRLVAGNADHSFGAEAVVRAAERAATTNVEDSEELLRGQLAGVLPDAHEFEFRASVERGTIRGRVDRTLSPGELSRFNHELLEVDVTARMRVKRVLRNGTVAREGFTLVGLEKLA